MPKRKADDLESNPSLADGKNLKHDLSQKAETAKRANLLVDSDSDGSEDESDGGALLEEQGFKINEDYAKRFEHNKKREELHKCKPSKIHRVLGHC